MARESHNRNLLETLQKLYAQIMRLVLHGRLNSYRHAQGDDSVIAGLYDYINHAPQAPGDEMAHLRVAAESPGLSKRSINNNKPSYQRAEVLPDGPNDLRDTFVNRHEYSALHDHMGEKLKASAWEHIHSSMRYAHEGNRETAMLHADIAANAIKEAVHYLEDNAYKDFIGEIGKVISDVNRHQVPTEAGK